MNQPNDEELLGDSLTDKAVLRHELRRLPIEDKLKVIALMQRRSNLIRRATGRPTTPEWSWPVVGLAPDSPPPRAGSLLAKLRIFEYARAEQNAAEEITILEDALSEHHPGVAAVMEWLEAASSVTDYISRYESSTEAYVSQFPTGCSSLENQSNSEVSPEG